MSTTLRERAREVKAAGEARRGVFTPPPLIRSIYDYWLKNTASTKGRQIRNGSRKENWCHFWRVVVFWAPLRAIGKGLEKATPVLFVLAALAGLVALVYAAFTVSDFWVGVVFAILGCAGAVTLILGMMSGIALANSEEARRIYDLPKGRFMWTFAVLGAPLAIPAYLIVNVFKGAKWLVEHHAKGTGISVVATAVTTFFGAVGLAGGWSAVLTTAAVGLLIGVVGTGIILGMIAMSTYVDGKRAVEQKEFEDFKLAYAEEHGKPYVAPVRRPSLTKRFFRGIGDLLIFVGQVARVKKWGICPLVDLER